MHFQKVTILVISPRKRKLFCRGQHFYRRKKHQLSTPLQKNATRGNKRDHSWFGCRLYLCIWLQLGVLWASGNIVLLLVQRPFFFYFIEPKFWMWHYDERQCCQKISTRDAPTNATWHQVIPFHSYVKKCSLNQSLLNCLSIGCWIGQGLGRMVGSNHVCAPKKDWQTLSSGQ